MKAVLGRLLKATHEWLNVLKTKLNRWDLPRTNYNVANIAIAMDVQMFASP